MRPGAGARARFAALGLVVAAGIATGVVSKARDLGIAFGAAPGSSVPESVRTGAAALRARVGPDAAIVHVSTDGDWSGCGVWQRVLHPRTVVCCRAGDPASVALFRDLRRRRLLRFAFGSGAPPPGLDLPARAEPVPGGLWIMRLEGAR